MNKPPKPHRGGQEEAKPANKRVAKSSMAEDLKSRVKGEGPQSSKEWKSWPSAKERGLKGRRK